MKRRTDKIALHAMMRRAKNCFCALSMCACVRAATTLPGRNDTFPPTQVQAASVIATRSTTTTTQSSTAPTSQSVSTSAPTTPSSTFWTVKSTTAATKSTVTGQIPTQFNAMPSTQATRL